MEREKTPDSKSVQTFIPATMGLSPGLEADIRERLVQAFGADDEKSPMKAYWGFEDLMSALLVEWVTSRRPVPDEVVRKWKGAAALPPAGLESMARYEAERVLPCEKSAETLKQALKKLAEDVRYGSRGGNWHSPLWFCGYEPGGCRFVKGETKYTVLDADSCSAVDLGYLPDAERFDQLNYPYARKLAAFVRSLFGEEHVDSTSEGLQKAVKELRLFAADGIGCDCNLYPVQRPNHNIWDQLGIMYKGVDFGLVRDITGAPDYPKDFIEARRNAWRNRLTEVLKKNPVVIIANGKREEFEELLCETKHGQWTEELEGDPERKIAVREIDLAKDENLHEGLLISMPHFSSHGLSNKVLADRANCIRKHLEGREKSGSDWREWFKRAASTGGSDS